MDEDRDGKVLLGATCHQRGALGAAGAANHPLKAEVLLSRVVIESRTKVASGAAFIFAFLLVRTTSEASHREVSDGYEKQREQPVHQPALRHRQVPEDVREPANQGADDHIVRRVWACARTWPLRRSMGVEITFVTVMVLLCSASVGTSPNALLVVDFGEGVQVLGNRKFGSAKRPHQTAAFWRVDLVGESLPAAGAVEGLVATHEHIFGLGDGCRAIAATVERMHWH
eukprot:CAMPEP_0177535174 /NCGR_PEP_ID=MMETSP0369-20130122/56404_1 /TAXON_ID=447022 ORGANISM="Scrippsiella hangoei-like, Strain SHHI-4" /NCGR_SAMPLE_ID=MMETSP0369 /ASSEMBLY_ACC=CAM_ASM_000364 /LENGTH=227 /DNA_ID=CAMNT_0019017303 /DNA_START=217 /DNA_END=901 /DNA_ORIENTATION=+